MNDIATNPPPATATTVAESPTPSEIEQLWTEWIDRKAARKVDRCYLATLRSTMREFLRTDHGRRSLEDIVRSESTDSRLQALAQLAADEPAPGTRGPVNCGTAATLRRGRAFQRLCAAYADGFRAATPVYPYLEEASA